jgi:hypothetical protein
VDSGARPANRAGRWWPILTFGILLIVIGSDERDHLQHLADVDRGIAAAVGSVSIYSLYTDYSERIDSCDYRMLVVCSPKPYDSSSFLTSLRQQPGNTASWIGAAIVNIPRLPDATFYALGKRWHQGWLPFALALVFLTGCVMLVIGAIQEKNYVAAFFVPMLVLAAMWVLKEVFLLLASGVLLFLEALILIGGIPAILAALLKFFHESREVKEGITEVAHTFKNVQ